MRFKIATIRLPSGETRQVVMERETGSGAADLTAESIKAALGYTPADQAEVEQLSETKVNKSTGGING